MIKIPANGTWSQTNENNKFGSIWYSKNVNFDKTGYLRLSPRSVNIFDDIENITNVSDTDFNFPVAFGRYDVGQFRVATTDEPFNISISDTGKTIAEDASSNNPNLAFNSHGVWWQNRYYESTDTTVSYNDNGTWTANAITGLTSGKRHYMAVFKNKQSLCVTDGNTVKLYNTSHSLQTTLTIPSDYEVIGIAYNYYKLGIVTRLGSDSSGQNAECFFFTWDGATSEAETGVGIGSYTSMVIFPYKSSFCVIDSLGRLNYWNGGGFQELAHFPFYLEENRWGDLLNFLSYGNAVTVDGDLIIINVGFKFDSTGKKGERYLVNNPSGVWCYDPDVGLYHRTSPSISRAYLHTVSQANINTTTNVFTTASTIPSTGNQAMLTSGSVGGLSNGIVYYIIRLSSTTFSLAETKELAESGVAIDITSADTNQYIWTYDIKDFGTTYSTVAGAIALYDYSKLAYKDYIFGGRYSNTSLGTNIYLCSNVPFLENRGYVVLARMFLNDALGNTQKVYLKHDILDTNDSIIVKVKRKKVLGLPTSSPNSVGTSELTFTGLREAYTETDLSEAKLFLDTYPDDELECEFIAGVGAGQMVKVTNIEYQSGVYSLTFEEDIVGASAGLKSYFVIDNWTTKGTVTSDTQDNGLYSFSINEFSPSILIKIELRGYDTTIEDIQITNKTHKPSV